MRKKKTDDTSTEDKSLATRCLRNGAPIECAPDPSRLLHELQQSEEQYRTVVEDLTEIICRTRGDGTLTFVNDVYCRVFGKTREDILGSRWYPDVFPDDLPMAKERLSTLSPSTPVVVVEKRVYTGSGEVRWLQFVNRGFFDSEAGLIEVQAVGRDITERKRTEDEIIKLNSDLSARTSELENANRELKAFNYMASHDLCQPLNNIFTSSQAVELMCGSMLDEECKGLLRIIKNAAMDMSKLIGKLLKFSHSEHAELLRKKVDLSAMARVVTAALRVNEPERRVTFKIDEGVMVDGVPELLRMVLENLFDNAWKHTGKKEQASIELGATEIDGRPTCFVRDNGTGFDMQKAEGIFLPFKRLQGSDNTGHGIGLATVERIIRRHGGKIWALAEPGKGATFFFTLGE
jgi:PAS domain S-box-containing protein